MKVVAFNGSPRKEGNTWTALKLVTDELEKEGIDSSIIHLGNKHIHGCTACYGCVKQKDERCTLKDDPVNEWIQMMKEADGIILGSPVYYSGIAGAMKCFLDRAFLVGGVNGSLFRHKVGSVVTAVRRSGGIPTFDQLNHYLNYSEMIIPTSNYWNVIHGRNPGEVLQDEEGVQIMKVLGKNMAWLMKLKEQGRTSCPPPEKEPKIYTHFIR